MIPAGPAEKLASTAASFGSCAFHFLARPQKLESDTPPPPELVVGVDVAGELPPPAAVVLADVEGLEELLPHAAAKTKTATVHATVSKRRCRAFPMTQTLYSQDAPWSTIICPAARTASPAPAEGGVDSPETRGARDGRSLGLAGLVVGQEPAAGPSHVRRRSHRGGWTSSHRPLFASLSRRQLTKIAGLAASKRYAAGSALVKSGAPGESVFVVLDGQAVVRAGARRITLGAGDFFGEMSLLDGEPRSATVTARTDVLVMMIPRSKFLKLLEKEPRIAIAVMTTLSGRVRALQAAAGV